MKQIKVMKTAVDFLAPLNFILWMHGFGFTMKAKRSCKYLAQFILSTFLVPITDGVLLFASILQLRDIYYLSTSKINREKIVLGILYLLEGVLRVLIHAKRRKLNALTKRTATMYRSVSSTSPKYTKYLLLCLAANEAFIVVRFLMFYFINEFSFILAYEEDDYGIIPQPFSAFAFYVHMFLVEYSIMSHVIPIYFCCLSYILQKILKKIRQRAFQSRKEGLKFLLYDYNGISSLISTINQVIQQILLLTFAILLLRLFYDSYIVLFKPYPKVVYRCTSIVYSFIRFLLMCCFASWVTKSATELKEALFDLPVPAKDKWRNIKFFVKMKDSFVGFKILDSLPIDRNLILSAIGTLLTYGIIIATFNINSKN